jgi:alkylation response protein AidB-like acyl-CoA dehydrogenase
MAELGWLGVTIDEDYGGSGGTMLDACLFMIETSRGLAPIGGYGTTAIVGGAVKRSVPRGRRPRSSVASPGAGWRRSR